MPTYVVCIDGSSNSDAAVRMLKVCTKSTDEITVMTAVPQCSNTSPEWKHAVQVVQSGSAALKERNVAIQIVQSSGDSIGDTLVSECDGHYDVVIVGTRGHGVVTKALMGSVSDKLVSKCRQSAVMVVPKKDYTSADGPVRCVCLSDGSEQAQQCSRVLAKILVETDHVYFLSVARKVDDTRHQGQVTTQSQFACLQCINAFTEAGGKAQYSEHVVQHSDPVTAAMDFVSAADGPIAFIAVGSRGFGKLDAHFFLGSTTQGLIQRAQLPILVATTPTTTPPQIS